MVDRIRGVPQARAVNEALQTAVELIQQYGATDDAWQDPDDVFGRLDQARAQVRTAWDELQVALRDEDETESTRKDTLDEQEMRVAFVEMITDAFADALESLRQEGDVDVEVLADCLQSGMDMIATSAHSMDEFSWLDDDEESEQVEEVIPHEKARRALGFTHAVGEAVA